MQNFAPRILKYSFPINDGKIHFFSKRSISPDDLMAACAKCRGKGMSVSAECLTNGSDGEK